MLDDLAALFQLGENVTHRVGEHIDELVKKRLVKPERAPVTHGAAQDAAQDVVAIGVPRLDAVGDREAQRADVVADDPKGGVDFFLSGGIVALKCRGVFFAAQFFELGKDGTENVGVVIGNRPAEVSEVARRLDDGGDTLEAHPGVHVPGGERHEGAVRVGVVLDENEVPNLDALPAAGVDEAAFRVGLRREVDVQLAARAARAGVAHHPEIILFVAVDDVHGGVEPGGGEDRRPTVVRLLVELARVAFRGLVHGGVEPLFRETPHAGEQFPSPLDRLLFEVVAKGPVAEHLEESVVVRVHSNVVEVVVLATGADAFLGVGGAAGGVRAGLLAEEDRHELVHAGVGEQQVGRVRHEAGRRHNGVLFLLKKI